MLIAGALFILNINAQNLPVNDSLKIIEKVYLHIDRDSYYPGDNIWFKAYLIDASDRFLTNHSLNLHVELISPDSKILDSRIIRISNGLGNGDFLLNKKLPSGHYRLRAYTNYMRNFSDELFFNRYITIINSSDANKILSDSVQYLRNKVDISFFPEGGSLVDEVASVVAFKAVNALGKGCDVSGTVYSSTGEMITSFKSSHKGMGRFSITPASGVNYYVIAKSKSGDSVKSELPSAFSEGIILNLAKIQANRLPLTIKTNNKTLSVINDQDMSLTLSSRNIPIKSISFRMKSLSNIYAIPIDELPEGIIMITISGMNRLPLCERLLYIYKNQGIKLKLETNKAEYKKRDSVSVKISFSDTSGIEQEAFLSLSSTEKIFKNDSTQFTSTISSWFLLESDVHGFVEEPACYFDSSNPNRLKDLDLLLCTQGWRDFKWKYDKKHFPPETGFTISGRVRKLFTDVPLENSKVNIVISGKSNAISGTIPTDSSGRFSLSGIEFDGHAKLFASAIGDDKKLKGMLLLDSINYSPAKIEDKTSKKRILLKAVQMNNTPQLTKENLNILLKDSETKQTIRKKYKLSDTIDIPEVVITARRRQEEHIKSSRPSYVTPDRELIVTPDFKIYNNPMQVLGFYFSGMMSGRYKYIIAMIDGVQVDPKSIAALPVDLIDRIDVLNTQASVSAISRFAMDMDIPKGPSGGSPKSGKTATKSVGEDSSPGTGALSSGGSGLGSGNPENDINGFTFPHTPNALVDAVINVITKTEWQSSTGHDYHTVNIKISGYDAARIFYSPKHYSSLETDYKPDMRKTLFWEPNIIAVANQDLFLNYFNSDNASAIKVSVEGITETGIPVTAETEYMVK